MALDPSNSSNLEQLALKRLICRTHQHCQPCLNPLKPSVILWLRFDIQRLECLISDIRSLWGQALRPERQSARMSEIKNGWLSL